MKFSSSKLRISTPLRFTLTFLVVFALLWLTNRLSSDIIAAINGWGSVGIALFSMLLVAIWEITSSLRTYWRKQEDLYRMMAEHSLDMIIKMDLDGTFLYVSPASRSLVGYEPEELIGKRVQDFLHPYERQKIMAHYTELSQHPTLNRTAHRFLRKDGTFGWMESRSNFIINSKGISEGLITVVRDITERKQAEEELQTTKEYLESFINNTADAIGVYFPDGTVLHVNAAAERIFGWSAEELLNKPERIIPDETYVEEAFELLRKATGGISVKEYETVRRTKDGTLIDVSITASPIKDEHGRIVAVSQIIRDITSRKLTEKALRESEAKYRLIAENTTDLICILDKNGELKYISPSHEMVTGHTPRCFDGKSGMPFVHPDEVPMVEETLANMFKEKKPFAFQYHYQHHDGHFLVMEATGMPVLGEDEEAESCVIISRDITQRIKSEELLRNSEKLSVVGELAAGIAHEIRNPLTSLKGFIQLFKYTNEVNHDHIQIMLSELDRINLIVSELLVLSRPQAIHFKKNNLHAILQNVIILLETQAIINNVQILTVWFAEEAFVHCEENQIKQLFINIIKNAIEASATGGTITLETRELDDHKLLIRLTDNGCGIPRDRLARLGEPFYSTKEQGTGLGLMISYKIVKDHQGDIQIESQVGQGTTVDVILPMMQNNQ